MPRRIKILGPDFPEVKDAFSERGRLDGDEAQWGRSIENIGVQQLGKSLEAAGQLRGFTRSKMFSINMTAVKPLLVLFTGLGVIEVGVVRIAFRI